MKATEAKLLTLLKKSPQFIIPIYQRTYSWTEKECRQLWDDILRTGGDAQVSAHFVGSVVYIEQGVYQVSSQSPLLVIDGQQRLTTVMLILEALARQVGDSEPVDGFSARKLRNYYLLNPEETGDQHYKLLLTQTDRDTLRALVRQSPLPAQHSLRISENFKLFTELVGALDDVTPLCHGLLKLLVVDIALSRDQDHPQLIFESMNSTGRELSQADLIRNYVLMGLEPEHQTRLYEDHWRPMEVAFGQEAYGSHFDAFMRHFLTYRTREIPNVRDVYQAFKAYAGTPAVADRGVDALVADVRKLAEYYCRMALAQEMDKALAEAFQDLRELKVDVAYPLLLQLYEAYDTQALPASELREIVRLIEAYVFRRAVCAIPTNSHNKTFARLGASLLGPLSLQSVQAHLLTLPSYRRFPTDEELRRDIVTRDLYNFPRRSYWLRRLENHGRKEHVPVDEYTIEHILPQNPNLSKPWRDALGPDWDAIQKRWLHTLGNLTLTGYNAEYGDRPFTEKRDKKGGFKQSPLRLNEGLGAVETWNEEAIVARADRLASLAITVWPAPSLTEEVLATYSAGAVEPPAYTIDDHPHLAPDSPMRSLFETLRAQVLAVDPSVTEEFLKLYVAYKAETNFVDVVPQKNRLRLSLNMRFHDLHDERKIAKDVTNIGRWGNGDVEVGLSDPADIPYVMGLVRQSFEQQMGGDAVDA